jgi:hypothetical protein
MLLLCENQRLGQYDLEIRRSAAGTEDSVTNLMPCMRAG